MAELCGSYRLPLAGAIALLSSLILATQTSCTSKYSATVQKSWLGQSSARSVIHETAAAASVPVVGAQMSDVAEWFNLPVRTHLAGRIESPKITELSGMAASRTRRDIYWALNDSGNQPELFAMNSAGKHIGSRKIALQNRDWEDMSGFVDSGTSWILVADTGDNLRRRSEVQLRFFREAELYGEGEKLQPDHSLSLTYEDGPQNVESVAVSLADRAVYLVAKAPHGANLYSVPLDDAMRSTKLIARKVGAIQPLGWTEDDAWWEKILVSGVLQTPTAMDISADETMAVVANYRHVYLYRRGESQSWPQALAGEPRIITSHRMAQSESVAFSADGRSVLVGSEGKHAPILIVKSSATALPMTQ